MTKRLTTYKPRPGAEHRVAILRALDELGEATSPGVCEHLGEPDARQSVRSVLSRMAADKLVRAIGTTLLPSGVTANVYQITSHGRDFMERGVRIPTPVTMYGVGRCALADIYGLSPR